MEKTAPQAKITPDMVQYIRKLYKMGVSAAQLGQAVKLSRVQVWRIVVRRSWAWVEDIPEQVSSPNPETAEGALTAGLLS